MGALIWGEIRRRWRGAAAVGIVSGIGFAAALTAAAGAGRTGSAFPRMLEATAAPQILVSSGDPDEAQRRRFYERIATLEGVERVGVIAGVGLVPMYVPQGGGTVIESCSNLPVDGIAGYEVYRPNVIEGRLPGVDRTDEILVTHTYAQAFGVGVGDELDLVLPAGDAIPAAGEATAADGPVAHVTIVGVGVRPDQIVPLSDLDRAPSIVASPAFVGRYAPEQEDQCYDGAVVLLASGGDVDRVGAEIERVAAPSRDALIQDLTSNYADVRRAIQPQATALWLFAAATAGATLLVVAQLLGRQLRQSATTGMAVWRAVGATPSQARTLIAAPSVVTAVVGAALALAVAVVLSGRFPIGPARLAEPDRGTQLQGWVHLGGAAVVAFIPLLVAGVIAAVARYAPTRPVALGALGRMSGATSQPAVVVGIHLATGSRRGEAAVPVRSAAAGVSLAVAAAVATMTFAGALDDLVSDPERYGRDWDVMVDGEFAPTPVAAVLERLGDHPAVAAIAGGRYGEVTIDGTRVPTVGLTDLVGRTFPAIIDGRAPDRDDEIVMGRRTLRAVGRSLGDTVAVDTGAGPRNMTIVGVAAFPRLNRGSFSTLGLGTGAITRAEAFPPYNSDVSEAPPEIDPEDFVGPGGATYEFVTIKARPEATAEERREIVATAREIGDANLQMVRTEQRPIAIDNYADVRSTPVVLAVVLGSMAAATLAHLVVSVVRRRRRDLAVCAALGMQRRQLASAVVVQALLVVGVAVLVGVPLGLAGGRVAWSRFAADLGVIETLRLPLFTVGLAVLVVVVVSVAVAAVPAVAAARMRPAAVLRDE
jgi:ABC-type lipoprotein release transport system permease subunit